MELSYFETIFKELTICKDKMEIRLQDMVVRSRGMCTVFGHQAINFEAVDEDMDPIFLRTVSVGDSTHCLKWDTDSGSWHDMGIILLSNEWKLNFFKNNWEMCGIQFPNGEIRHLKDIFSECLGHRHDGLIFVGKGRYDGENLLIRLDIETRLLDFYDEQRCEKFNKEIDEWEFWGMLVKKLRKKK